MSTPSRNTWSPIVRCSGTTTMPRSPARSAGRLAALSVTTLTNRTSLRLRRVSPTRRPRPGSPIGFSTQMTDSGQSDASKVLRATGFRRLLIGQAVSGLGDWVATLAFIALAYELTQSQTAVAVVLVIRLVPPIFAAPVGGLLADRVDRRLLMVSCDLVRGVLICLVPFVGIGLLYVIAVVHGST